MVSKETVVEPGKPFLARRGILFGGVAACAGVSGYVFNALVARTWGAPLLGGLLATVGALAVVGLPASLITLPSGRWAAQTAGWRARLPVLQGIALLVGLSIALVIWLASKSAAVEIHVPDRHWWLPLIVWMVPLYLGSFNHGVLLGRRAYDALAAVVAVPGIGKLAILAADLGLGGRVPASSVWAIAIAGWLATILGVILVYRSGEPSDRVVPFVGLWASGWVTAVTQAWTSWDVAVAGIILPGPQLAIYAVVATVGKVPYHLTTLITNVGIGETGWGKGWRNGVRLLIVAIGVATLMGVAAMGRWLIVFFGLQGGMAALLVYVVVSTMLALAFFETGCDAQVGRHTWWPLAAALVVWTMWAIGRHPTVLSLIAGLGVSLLAAVVGVWAVRTRRQSGA